MIQRPRQIEDSEFLTGFINLVKRLDLQICNIDQGHNYVRDDLAGVLRTLFCRGKGNDAIRRFCARFSLELPKIKVSGEIQKTSNLLFGFSCLGLFDDTAEYSEVSVPDELAVLKCVLVRHKNILHRFTWENVVEAYGNTYGSHLSTTIPHFFDRVQVYGAGHSDFGSFLLRNLGVIIADCCHSLLGPRSNEVFPKHSPYFNGIQISTALYYRKKSKDEMIAHVRKEDWKSAGKIFTVESPEGDTLVYSIAEGGYLSLTKEKNGN